MKKESINFDLERLLSSRAFDELSATDQAQVLQEMTAQEYQMQRWALLAARDTFVAEKLPALPGADAVLRQFTSRKSAGVSSMSWLDYFTGMRIPAWQVAMALLFGWAIGFWGGSNNESALGMMMPPSYATDTIVREIPVFVGIGAEKLAEITDSQSLKAWIEKNGYRNTAIIKGEEYFREVERNAGRSVPAAVFTGSRSSIAEEKELLDLVVGVR